MLVTVATCNLNQWALDFDGNLDRIYTSCIEARDIHKASYRLGPELEICGYGCEDHFYENDTIDHCWETLILLLQKGVSDNNMICDFGMPLLYNSVRYNCRIICQNRTILLIRPKCSLADNGNYRESRYFTAYPKNGPIQQYILPKEFVTEFHQSTVPFGVVSLNFTLDNISIGCESCEELWTPYSTHIDLALNGIDIITNGSGSHHELRKLNTRLDLIQNATRKCGGLYLYSNQRGCDGSRLYYDGGACIVYNGIVVAQASQFSLTDVEVISATIDINDIRSYRASIPSLGVQAVSRILNNNNQNHPSNMLLHVNAAVSNHSSTNIHATSTTATTTAKATTITNTNTPSKGIVNNELQFHSVEEECCIGPACWLWDYLRRSGATGFFLPLSGGADSSSVAIIVYAMCTIATTTAQTNPTGTVANDIRRICHKQQTTTTNNNNNSTSTTSNWVPESPQVLANYILHTTYMGTINSSTTTYNRAKRLSTAIGSYHLSITIDTIITSIIQLFTATTNLTPKFLVNGGTNTQDLALQNIQARIRMVLSYLLAQLLPWVRYSGTSNSSSNSNSSSGFLLVLGSANVDEGLRGYMTKYDCSSADLNPIGGISKNDLKSMLLWASNQYDTVPDMKSILYEIATATPTAELRPIEPSSPSDTDTVSNDDKNNNSNNYTQYDEDEMGMTYNELSVYGTLRKLSRCGPVSMFIKLVVLWGTTGISITDIASKVQRFFTYYSINRHKMCTITPSYHAEGYSPDDNRFDLRQFLYNTQWTRQFTCINNLIPFYQERQQQVQQQEQNTSTSPSTN